MCPQTQISTQAYKKCSNWFHVPNTLVSWASLRTRCAEVWD